MKQGGKREGRQTEGEGKRKGLLDTFDWPSGTEGGSSQGLHSLQQVDLTVAPRPFLFGINCEK